MKAGLIERLQAISRRVYWKEILALMMLLMAIVFFRSERKDLGTILPHLQSANPSWLFVALALTICSFYLQGGIYRKCFAAVDLILPWSSAVSLYLKRNFISVF